MFARCFFLRGVEKMMAESEGFEPPIDLRLCLISSQVHSTGLCQLSVKSVYRPMRGRRNDAADEPIAARLRALCQQAYGRRRTIAANKSISLETSAELVVSYGRSLPAFQVEVLPCSPVFYTRHSQSSCVFCLPAVAPEALRLVAPQRPAVRPARAAAAVQAAAVVQAAAEVQAAPAVRAEQRAL